MPLCTKLLGASRRGFTLIESLLYLSVLSILLGGIANSTKNLLSLNKRQVTLIETTEAIKNAVTASRLTKEEIQIIYSLGSTIDQRKLIFLYPNNHKSIIKIDDKNIINLKISSGSIFRDHLQIYPNGFASPASIVFNYNDNTECTISLSRLGAAKYAC